MNSENIWKLAVGTFLAICIVAIGVRGVHAQETCPSGMTKAQANQLMRQDGGWDTPTVYSREEMVKIEQTLEAEINRDITWTSTDFDFAVVYNHRTQNVARLLFMKGECFVGWSAGPKSHFNAIVRKALGERADNG